MEHQGKAVLFFTLLGIIEGLVSYKLGNRYSYIAGSFLLLYFVSVLPIIKWVKSNKAWSWLIKNTLITYLLVWLTTWTLLYNVLG